MSSLDIRATNVFVKNWKTDKKISVNRGWTRSSKTFSLLQMCFVWLVTGKIDNDKYFDDWILSIVRKYSATLNATVIRDFEEIISSNWYDFLLSEKHRSKSEKTYRYDGRIVEFMGADDEQKIRWRKRDILYCNEANELTYEKEFFQLMIRTKYKIFIDFNPDDENIWINTELEQKRAIEKWDVGIIVSTYKDNPFLEKSIIEEIEYLGKTNEAYWRIYWLWEYGTVDWLIFPKRQELFEMPDNYKFLWYWLDFWFSNDPSAMIGLYQIDDGIVLDEVLYERWLTNQDLVHKFANNGVDKTDDIIADSAEPKSIEEIYRWWYNIHPAQKWPDSIKFGIDIMLQHNIYITSRSENLKKEFRAYSRKKDKNWKYLQVPSGWLDHGIDSARYVCTALLKKTDMFITIHDDRGR